MKRLSTKQADRLRLYQKAKRRWWRDLIVRVCRWPECMRVPDKSPHHKHGRAGSLLCETRLFIPLCKHHHDYLHQSDKGMREARRYGLLCEKGWWGRNPFDDKCKAEAGI